MNTSDRDIGGIMNNCVDEPHKSVVTDCSGEGDFKSVRQSATLGIATTVDWVVQAALKLVLESRTLATASDNGTVRL